MFLQVLFWIRTPSRTAPRYVNQVIAKHAPRIKLLCSPWLLSCLVKKTESGSLLGHAEKKIRLTKFIKRTERSCLSCLKRWRVFFAGASYLLVGMILSWDLTAVKGMSYLERNVGSLVCFFVDPGPQSLRVWWLNPALEFCRYAFSRYRGTA